MDLKSYLEECRRLVDAAMSTFLETADVSPNLQKAMLYSLEAGGKRIRPALAFAACEAVGGKSDEALPAACALEMIHTYSLIHDDLPAMDNDDLRRGRPTNHKVFGDALAILAGDGLLTEAFRLLADPSWKLPAERRIDIVGIVAEGAGAMGMVAGQVLDLEGEGKSLDETSLEKVHRHKTGKLLRASVLAGGKSGGADRGAMEQLDRYGKAIGLAFQIADDLLDVTATTEQLGKGAGKDQDRNKSTYPALLGIEESKHRAAALLDEAIAALRVFGDKGSRLVELARLIVQRSS